MDQTPPKLTLENTEVAYAHKSDWEMRKAYGLFQLFSHKALVDIGGWATKTALKWHLPVQPVIRHTVYEQFVGGTTLRELNRTVKSLAEHNVHAILDWGGEGKTGDNEFDSTLKNHLQTLDYVSNIDRVKLIAVKVTGLGRFKLLAKLHAGETLSESEQREYTKLKDRMWQLCSKAAESNTAIFFDAEETWIQQPIDDMLHELMMQFNKKQALVYNTYQVYLKDRSTVLKKHLEQAKANGYVLGVKMVRGAYMEKERERAYRKGYASPIHENKAAVDADYNATIDYCLDNLGDLSLCAATHNEESTLYLANQIEARSIARNNPHVFFSQLYGMGDHITFNLAQAGYTATKLIPYGPVTDVVPYLVRRAQENSSVSGQVGRELTMITKEMKRRRIL